MATRAHVRLLGTLGNPASERWGIGLNYKAATGQGFTDPVAVQGFAQGIADYLETVTTLGPVQGEMGTDAKITQVEVYTYGATGPALARGLAPLSPVLSGSGLTKAPFQTARVVTLKTTQPGARRRGRIYLPMLCPNMAPNGTAIVASGYLTALAGVLVGIGNEWGGDDTLELGVYSGVDNVVTPVTQLRVGDIPDTQRRRRDGLAETFVQLNL